MIDLEQMNLDRELRDQTQAEEEPYVGELVEVKIEELKGK